MNQQPMRDVRMRGFQQRSTVESALAWVAKCAQRRAAERVPVGQSAARVLAEDIVSRVNVPAFARAMMDGFAIRAADVNGAAAYHPLALKIVGQSFPGQPSSGEVGRGQAIKIMTGAPLPAGADTVLPVEKTEIEADRVCALESLPAGKNVALVGEDIAAGQIVLSAGRQLRPQDVGVLASIGIGQVPVVQQAVVRIIVTGNELLPAGEVPTGNKIVDSNSPMLESLVARDGGRVVNPGIVPDDEELIRTALRSEVDVLLVSGGSSVGEEDHAPRLVAEMGQLDIHGIAMRPSSPAGMGTIDDRLVFLLPGNPVSCLCAYDFFAARAIRGLAGRPPHWPYLKIRRRLSRKLVSAVGRTDYCRVRFEPARDDPSFTNDALIEPLAIRGASILSSTTRADGFVIVDADSEGFPAGHEVTVFLYDDPATVSQCY